MSTPDLEALLALQDLDTHINQEMHRRAHLPERAELAELERLMDQKQLARSVVSSTLAEVASRQATAERELKATEDRAAQVNARLFDGTVTASRELQAMSSDVDGLRRRASELEDKVLTLMEEREPFDTELGVLDAQLADLAERHRVTSERLSRAETAVNAALDGLESGRPATAGAVDEKLLAVYDRLRARLEGVAVSRLIGGRCDGCHLSLPAMELDRIRRQPAGSLEHCEQCGRILVIAGA